MMSQLLMNSSLLLPIGHTNYTTRSPYSLMDGGRRAMRYGKTFRRPTGMTSSSMLNSKSASRSVLYRDGIVTGMALIFYQDDIDGFFKSEKIYKDLAIPWKVGKAFNCFVLLLNVIPCTARGDFPGTSRQREDHQYQGNYESLAPSLFA